MKWQKRKKAETGQVRLKRRFALRPVALSNSPHVIWLEYYWSIEKYDLASGGWFCSVATQGKPPTLEQLNTWDRSSVAREIGAFVGPPT